MLQYLPVLTFKLASGTVLPETTGINWIASALAVIAADGDEAPPPPELTAMELIELAMVVVVGGLCPHRLSRSRGGAPIAVTAALG